MVIKSYYLCLAALLLILLSGIIVYSNTLHVPFVLDDHDAIINETLVHNLDNFRLGAKENILSHPRWFGYLSFALNYHYGGLDVTGYHVVNLLIHLSTGLLVFSLLWLTFNTPYCRARGADEPDLKSKSPLACLLLDKRFFIPFFSALLFVIHPVQTQAVTYLVQRVTSLVTLFYLLSILLYVIARLRIEASLHSQQSGAPIGSSGSPLELREAVNLLQPDKGPSPRGCYRHIKVILPLAGSIFAAILAMKTKEIAFTLPIAITLYEIFFFRGGWKRRQLYLLPFFLLLPIIPLSVLAVGKILGQATGDLVTDVGQQTLVHGSLSNFEYLFTEFRVIITYLRLLIFPVNLNLDYDYPVFTTFFTRPVILSFLLLTLILLSAVFLFWKTRWRHWDSNRDFSGSEGRESKTATVDISTYLRIISFGMLWFFLTLSVESSFISIADVIAEHRLYLPSFGAAMVFATVVSLLIHKFNKLTSNKLYLVYVPLFMVIVLLGYMTYQRNYVWGNAVRLWEDVIMKSPNKARPHINLGIALFDDARLDDAINTLKKAVRLDPGDANAYTNLGLVYIMNDQSSLAVPVLRRALVLDQTSKSAYINLAMAFNQLRRFRQTVDLLEKNLDLVQDKAEAQYHLGVAYAFLGNQKAAEQKLKIITLHNNVLAEDLARLLDMGPR